MVLELGTYLDTHPDDMEAFDLFKQYAAMEKAAKETYEANSAADEEQRRLPGRPTAGSRIRGPGIISRMR